MRSFVSFSWYLYFWHLLFALVKATNLKSIFLYIPDEAKTYRGDYTDTTVMRVSQSAPTNDTIAKNFDKQANVKQPSGRHEKHISWAEDVLKLVGQYGDKNLFENIPGRKHGSFAEFSSRVVDLEPDYVRDWLYKTMRKLRRRNNYTQFLD